MWGGDFSITPIVKLLTLDGKRENFSCVWGGHYLSACVCVILFFLWDSRVWPLVTSQYFTIAKRFILWHKRGMPATLVVQRCCSLVQNSASGYLLGPEKLLRLFMYIRTLVYWTLLVHLCNSCQKNLLQNFAGVRLIWGIEKWRAFSPGRSLRCLVNFLIVFIATVHRLGAFLKICYYRNNSHAKNSSCAAGWQAPSITVLIPSTIYGTYCSPAKTYIDNLLLLLYYPVLYISCPERQIKRRFHYCADTKNFYLRN